MTSTSASAQHLRDLAQLRRVRDRIDREYAQRLNVESLARGVNMRPGTSAAHAGSHTASRRTPTS